MAMRPVDPARVSEALRLDPLWPVDLEPDARSTPLADLDLRAVAESLTSRLGSARAPVPLRVRLSTAVMGLASRLWAATVVPYAGRGILVDPGCLVVRDDGGSLVLGAPAPAGWTGATPADLARVVRGLLAPPIEALPVAHRLLWGNVAASLHGVPRVQGLPAARPVVTKLLTDLGLDGELEVTAGGRVRRRTCCLFYVVPGAGLCGDCVFDTVPAAGRSARGGPDEPG